MNSDIEESFHSYGTRQMRIGATDRLLTLNTILAGRWFKGMLNDNVDGHIFAATTILYVINILQLNKMFENEAGFFADPFVSTTGIILKRTLHLFHHSLKDSNIGIDNKNTGNHQNFQISLNIMVTNASSMKKFESNIIRF